LFAVDADQANGTDADLLVDPLATVVRRVSVGRTNTSISFISGNASPQSDGLTTATSVSKGGAIGVSSPASV
jgi:hypothetical protein